MNREEAEELTQAVGPIPLQTIPITDVKIGQRIRKFYGDLGALAESIRDLGMLHPIVVRSDMTLIAGERRLRAARDLLGWTHIPATVINLDDVLDGEHAENEIREDFTYSEKVDMKRAIEARIGERRGGDRTGKVEIFPPCSEVPAGEKTRAYVAEKAGLGNETTARQAEFVVDNAAEELVEAMDAGLIAPSQAAKIAKKSKEEQTKIAEKVLGGAKPTEAARQVRREEIGAKVEAIPSGQYRVIYADPPWAYNDKQGGEISESYGAAEKHYPSMTLAELSVLGVREISAEDSVLFLWATSPLLPDALTLVKAWGFTYKASFVWDKVKHNMGHYNSVRHEFLLICTRGSCTPQNSKLYDSVQSIERTKHSEKPEFFREIIETLYPQGKRIELFARKRVDGWCSWGNEA